MKQSDLAYLEQLAKNAEDSGEWKQGRVLDTEQTRRWSAEEKRAAEDQERLRVFSSFNYYDGGRGRALIATCADTAIAEFVAAASPKTVIKLIEDNRKLRERRDEPWHEFMAKVAGYSTLGSSAGYLIFSGIRYLLGV